MTLIDRETENKECRNMITLNFALNVMRLPYFLVITNFHVMLVAKPT